VCCENEEDKIKWLHL